MANELRIARTALSVDRVSLDEVLRYLGHQGQELSHELEGRIDEAIRRGLSLARPRASLASYPIASRDTDIALTGCTLRLCGNDLAEHLSDATDVVLFAVTIGAEVDRELRRLSLIDPVGQVLFDAVATALVERATDAAEAMVRRFAAERSRYTSWRFSPGYGDFPLTAQGDLLAALDATRQLGITLTESNLMLPTKSVTALVGIHPTPQPGLASTCSVCSLSDYCTLPSTGRTCRGSQL